MICVESLSHTHTRTDSLSLTHAHWLTLTNTHALTHSQPHTRTHSLSPTHAHLHTLAHTRALTHPYAHTRTHTLAFPIFCWHHRQRTSWSVTPMMRFQFLFSNLCILAHTCSLSLTHRRTHFLFSLRLLTLCPMSTLPYKIRYVHLNSDANHFFISPFSSNRLNTMGN